MEFSSTEFYEAQSRLGHIDPKHSDVLQDGEIVFKTDKNFRRTEDDRLYWYRITTHQQFDWAFSPGWSDREDWSTIHGKFADLALRKSSAIFATDGIPADTAYLMDISSLPALREPSPFEQLERGEWSIRALLVVESSPYFDALEPCAFI